jgi:hypothetical protein
VEREGKEGEGGGERERDGVGWRGVGRGGGGGVNLGEHLAHAGGSTYGALLVRRCQR